MTLVEERLSQAMSPPSADTAGGDWDAVLRTADRRRKRRVATFRFTVLTFAVLALGAVLGTSQNVDLTAALFGPDVQTLEPRSGEPSSWPTASGVFDAAGDRPGAPLWAAWAVAIGLPGLVALALWTAAPAHLRTREPSQRWARGTLAAAGAAGTLTGVGVLAGASLLVLYDPLAAQTGQSWLVTFLAISSRAFAIAVVALLFCGQAERVAPGRSIWRFGSLVFGGATSLMAFPILTVALDALGRLFAWQRAEGTELPTRGVWRLLVPQDIEYWRASGEGSISTVTTWLGAGAAITFVGLVFWSCWRAANRVLASAPLQRPSVGDLTLTKVARVSLITVSVVFPVWDVVAQDVRARSVAYVVAAPPALGDLDTVRTTRVIDSNPFDGYRLVDIQLTPLADEGTGSFDASVSADELIRGAAERNSGYWRQPESDPTNLISDREWWTIDERDGSLLIRGESDPVSSFTPLLTEALFFSVLLLLLATSSRDSTRNRVRGAATAGWWGVGAGGYLIGQMVYAIVRTEELVGEAALDLPTIHDRISESTNLEVHRLWTTWLYIAGAGAFFPVFTLVVWALHRLHRRRWLTFALLAVAIAAVPIIESVWGTTIEAGQWIVE